MQAQTAVTPDWYEVGRELAGESSVRAALRTLGRRNGRLNFADIARRSGIRSRSYVRMLFRGEKSASLETLKNVLSSVKAPAPVRRYLVAMHEFESTPDGTALHKRRHRNLERLRAKLRQTGSLTAPETAYSTVDLPRVYAALGAANEGATPAEVRARTRLSADRVHAALEACLALRLARLSDSRYYALSPELLLDGASGGGSFQEFYLRSAERSIAMAKSSFDSRANLFSAFCVSVDSRRLREHADRFYRTLTEFLSEIEDPDGDTVVTLNAGFHRD